MFLYAFAFIYAFMCFLFMLLYFYTLIYASICFPALFLRFFKAFLRFPMLSCAFPMLSYPFIRFYMLLHALFGRSVRTTREAASLSNRLLPAEAGKKLLVLTVQIAASQQFVHCPAD